MGKVPGGKRRPSPKGWQAFPGRSGSEWRQNWIPWGRSRGRLGKVSKKCRDLPRQKWRRGPWEAKVMGKVPGGKVDLPQRGGRPSPEEVPLSGARAGFLGEGHGCVWGRWQDDLGKVSKKWRDLPRRKWHRGPWEAKVMGKVPGGKVDLPQRGGRPSPEEVPLSGARAGFLGEGHGCVLGRSQKSDVTFPARNDTECPGRPK